MLRVGDSHHLNIVRIILALLISLSLTLAPGASAFAAMQTNGTAHGVDHAVANTDMSADMTDCMKMMQAAGDQTTATKHDGSCKCCATQNKCPDTANCMSKCCKVIGALKPAGKFIKLSSTAYRQVEPAKPPEWLRTPPAPPPRS